MEGHDIYNPQLILLEPIPVLHLGWTSEGLTGQDLVSMGPDDHAGMIDMCLGT